MAANGVLEPLEEHKTFNCHYRQKILAEYLIGIGDERYAIPNGISVGAIGEHNDFVIERGFILPDLSPGLSTFTEPLVEHLRQPEKCWILERGTPFPEELEIKFDGRRVAIKPRNPMKKERLEEMLKWLPWRKYTHYGGPVAMEIQ